MNIIAKSLHGRITQQKTDDQTDGCDEYNQEVQNPTRTTEKAQLFIEHEFLQIEPNEQEIRLLDRTLTDSEWELVPAEEDFHTMTLSSLSEADDE